MNSSRIFWHFVGSPEKIDWSTVQKPKDITSKSGPKPNKKSWEILKAILESKKLVATCNEKLYGYRKTDKFCCVTDLQMKNLLSHREYYGNVAIGFRSENIYSNFTPVLYTPIKNFLTHAIETREEFEEWTLSELKSMGMDEEIALRSGYEKTVDGKFRGSSLIIDYAKNSPLEKYVLNFVKGTKFSDEPGESFYQEKEWRKINDFNFENYDIAAVIIPKEYVSQTIELLNKLKIDKTSILTWEIIDKT
jgi:hypothetical protein